MAWITPIASGPNALGDLSGQYWNVAQSNLRTQEGDIARANAAQHGWNRWNASVADLQNQQEAEQYRRDRNERGEQRHQFEWGVGQKYNQDVLGLKRAEINRALADERLAEGDEVNAIEFVKQRIADTGNAYDKATKRLETAKHSFDTRFNDVQKELPSGKVKFDRATGSFLSLVGAADPTLNAAIANANDTLTRHVSEYSLAQQEHKNVADQFQQAQQQLPRGVQVGKKDGKWVINSPTLRRTFAGATPPPIVFGASLGNRHEEMPGTPGFITPAPRWTPIAPPPAASASAPQMNPTPAAAKVQLANRLSAEHPEWTRQQIVSEVNLVFSTTPPR